MPERKCAACGAEKGKLDLIRIVRDSTGAVSVDLNGKRPGRGVYICYSPDCLKKAKKAKRVERGLAVPIPEDVYADLERVVETREST